MSIIKNILLILVGIVFFLVGFMAFAPALLVSSFFRLVTTLFTIMLFTGLMCISKAIGTEEQQELVSKYTLDALEAL